jgi:glycosyltransferase involved in cell wall biosynthesis
MKLVSIVTPCFNEEENIEELHRRVAEVMSALPYDYEHICIDNRSTDGTVAKLRKLAEVDTRLKVIVNSRNFGHIRSPFHGLLQGGGDAVIIIASDLQDPPELIPELLTEWEKGFKTVLLVKPQSEESPVMFAIRRLYYGIISKISDVPLVPNATGAGLYDRKIVDALRQLRDPYPYVRGLVAEIGFPIATVPFRQPRRRRGISKNNFYTLYDIAMLGITSHSKVPLRLMTMFGFLFSILSFGVAIGFLIAKLVFWDQFQLGLAPLLIGLFFFMAVQMFFIGLLGEYIGAVLTHVRGVPHVFEAERINFKSASSENEAKDHDRGTA